MNRKVTKIIYVIKNANINYSTNKLLDFIMDDNDNIICWTKSKNAIEFLKKTGLEEDSIVCRTTIDKIQNELNQKRNIIDGIGIRIIKNIDFD